MSLPSFKYHPDPIATGSIEASDARCACCGEARGYIYTGPVYADADLDDTICPWCIGSGLAHEKYDAEFTDKAAVGGYDYFLRKNVTQKVKQEVANRTPGFNGWQQEKWLVHCGDACAFLGPAGSREVQTFESQDLLDSLRADIQMNEDEFREYLNSMDKECGPTAYIFKCLHCGQLLGYSDFT
jgi:hypothetical protein